MDGVRPPHPRQGGLAGAVAGVVDEIDGAASSGVERVAYSQANPWTGHLHLSPG